MDSLTSLQAGASESRQLSWRKQRRKKGSREKKRMAQRIKIASCEFCREVAEPGRKAWFKCLRDQEPGLGGYLVPWGNSSRASDFQGPYPGSLDEKGMLRPFL